MPRPRRKSSGLGADLRGDTGAVALSTLEPTPTFNSPPLTPRNSQTKSSRPFSKRRKAKSVLRRWKTFSFRHTWVNPLIIIVLILSAYAVNPSPSNPLHNAIFLSYALPSDHRLIPYHAQHNADIIYYGKGPKDFAFVAFYVVVLSFTREFLMQRLIRPMALYYGIRSRSKQNRFMEQVYTAMYFAVFGPLGLYIMSRTPVWYFNTAGMFEGFPHRSHEGVFKAYYLLQASYWAQQAIVLCLQLEKPRKDFKELVGHHIVTLALIWLSYRFHFTYMGLAVYITHDISDFFLATSKTFNYINSPLIVPYFSLFIAIWTYLRHYINIVILYATLTEFRTVGPFDLNWETQQYKCWISQYITFALLASLQSINLLWLFFIVRIAYNIAFAKVVQDVRSDDEESDEEKEGEGEQIDTAGWEAKENKPNGRLANGKAPKPNTEDVAEGKKER
ncbi:hypothetical protein IMSHALPRED_006492 [Imshaugia aleurites]|uniref:TLC domain-containing protein n=1 Tax=Imshaugia aleurites TaxID=172621 RepID=A0A8H3EPF0_9LECA|nr:hypothetical protein IMSHALPRED_006492 [Imshaugia aleurites]